MADSSRNSWIATTHSWARDLDRPHLDDARRLVGAVGPDQLVHLVLEVLAYADDEAVDQGRIGEATIEIGSNWLAISDDGRGTDTRREASGAIVRKPVMATRDIRFFDNSEAPRLPDGMARQGMSTVAAVAPELIHENRRPEGAWSQSYRFGVPDSELVEVQRWSGTGTTVRLGGFEREVVAGVDIGRIAAFAAGFLHLAVTVVES